MLKFFYSQYALFFNTSYESFKKFFLNTLIENEYSNRYKKIINNK